tara:strand:- start:849 stop:971 length:123 start_codon:yes stop_codon:yes gene_type:complete
MMMVGIEGSSEIGLKMNFPTDGGCKALGNPMLKGYSKGRY